MISLEKRAYRYLRRELLRGRITAGTRLSDLALSKQIGMSRTPVRHAIRMLESDGIAAQLPSGGSVVRKPTRKAMAVLFDLRIMLEGYAAARAARALSDEQLAELWQLQDSMRSILHDFRDSGATHLPEETRFRWAKIEIAFHQTILRSTGVRTVSKVVSDLGILTRLYYGNRSPTGNPLREMARAYRSHHRVLKALQRRDPREARRAMRLHIRAAKKGFLPSTKTAPAKS
jgi:DNA-binding GntR family transcriptional regulator